MTSEMSELEYHHKMGIDEFHDGTTRGGGAGGWGGGRGGGGGGGGGVKLPAREVRPAMPPPASTWSRHWWGGSFFSSIAALGRPTAERFPQSWNCSADAGTRNRITTLQNHAEFD